MEEKISGIVLKQKDYRETDVALTILSETGIVELLAKGLKKIGAKNQAACQLFVRSEFIVAYPSETARGVVTTASLIENFRLNSNLEAIAIMTVVGEVIDRYFAKDDFYNDVLALLKSLNEGKTYWLDFCWIIKRWIEISGVTPQVDKCYNCENKQIIALSLSGGFVCKQCFTSYDLHYTKEQLQLFRYLFKAHAVNKENLRTLDYDWQLVQLLMRYYLYHQPTELKSWQFLTQLFTIDN